MLRLLSITVLSYRSITLNKLHYIITDFKRVIDRVNRLKHHTVIDSILSAKELFRSLSIMVSVPIDR